MPENEIPPDVDKTADIAEAKAKNEPESPETTVLETKEGIQDLKMKLDQERAARIDAEKQAQRANYSFAEAKNEVQDTNLQLVRNAIDTVKRNNDILKYNYSEALAVGDYPKAADIQENMSMNAAKLMELDRGRSHMESAPKIVPVEPQRAMDPVEHFASQLSPRSADWVRRNPNFVTDRRLNQKMIAAHTIALADGYAPDTDEYFEHVEDTLKMRRRADTEDDDPSSSAAKVTQRRSAPPSAPVSRGGTGTGSRSSDNNLSREERETARDIGMTEKAYLANKQLLKSEGRA